MSGRVRSLDGFEPSAVGEGAQTSVDRSLLATPAVLVTGALFLSRLGVNARTDVPLDIVALQDVLVPLGAVACVGSLAAIAVLTDDPVEAVGLAFVAAFGLVGTFARPAAVPAVVAVVAGGGLVLVRRALDGRRMGPTLVGSLLLAGLASSLAGVLGVAPVASRTVGTQLALLGVAGTPVFLARSRADWLAGAVAGAGLVAVGVAAPFVLGATGLVAGGIVGASLPLMTLAVGGLGTTASAAVRTRRHAPALGAGLLLFAGVPATLPRALTVVLALALLLGASGGVSDA